MFHYQGICRWCLSTKYESKENKKQKQNHHFSDHKFLMLSQGLSQVNVTGIYMYMYHIYSGIHVGGICILATCQTFIMINGFHGKKIMRLRNWTSQSKVLNQQQLMCLKPGIFLTNDIPTRKF